MTDCFYSALFINVRSYATELDQSPVTPQTAAPDLTVLLLGDGDGRDERGDSPHNTFVFGQYADLASRPLSDYCCDGFGLPQPQGWRAWLWIALFGWVDVTLFQGFLATGLVRTEAGLGSVMIDSQPLAVALLALWLYGETIGLWGWLGLIIGIIGIGLIGLPDAWVVNLVQGHVVLNGAFTLEWSQIPQLFNSGELLMLLAALAMAVGTS